MNTQGFSGLKVIIVNWCKAADTIVCIHSLVDANLPLNCLLVVDNGSNDDSVLQITQAFQKIEILTLPDNLGFAGGYNYGINSALKTKADKILILNNDTIVDKNTIPSLLTAEWDISVPKIYYVDPPDLIWSAGARWRRLPPMVIMRGYQKKDSLRYNNEIELEYATACALMIKRKVFETVGMFDEEFKNYFEDYDFIYRVRQAGFRIGYIPEAKVWHKVSQSLGTDSPQRLRYLGRNSVLFYRKNKRFSMWVYLCYVTWVSTREIMKFNFRQMREFWRGTREGMDWINNGPRSL